MKSLFLLLLCGSAFAKAPPPPPPERPARFYTDGERLALAVEFPDLIDEGVRRKLDGGLATTVVARAYLARDGSSRAEALVVQTVRTAYDLWDEVYVSEVTSDSGVRVFRDKRRDDALHRMALLQLPLVPLSRVEPGARYRVAVIVELNPVSPALLAQVRRWLSRPREGAPLDGDSYFGSFVSLFVERRVGQAEKVLQFRTQVYGK